MEMKGLAEIISSKGPKRGEKKKEKNITQCKFTQRSGCILFSESGIPFYQLLISHFRF